MFLDFELNYKKCKNDRCKVNILIDIYNSYLEKQPNFSLQLMNDCHDRYNYIRKSDF